MSTKLNDLNVASMVFSTKDRRPALQYLKIVEDKAIVTDGHILIATDLPKDDAEINPEVILKDYETKTPVLTIGLNSALARKIFEFLEQFTDSKVNKKLAIPGIVKLSFYSSNEAIKIEAKNETTGQNLTALLMPCRIE